MNRQVISRNPAVRQDIGDLVTRAPEPTLTGPSPFLLIAHHGPQTMPANNGGLPFTRHPHKGFETVTFVRHGALMHEDSRFDAKLVHAGGVQWMTAGNGVIHNESAPPEFRRTGGDLEIFQLWLNLPSKLKSSAPNYVGLEASEIPVVLADEDRVRIQVVAGKFGDTTGPVKSLTDAAIFTMEMKAGGHVVLPAPKGRSIFLYVANGSVFAGGHPIEPHDRVEFDQSGHLVDLTAHSDAYLIYGHAPLIHEPVTARGPFVMTTPAEVQQAAHEYQAGLFN